jgi:putative ABC transport system permease protein
MKDMAMLNKLRLRLRALFFKYRMEEELDEEVRFHLEREIEENIVRGMSPEEARYAAIRSFGGVERVKEETRDVRGVRLLEEVWQDLRYGTRMLGRSPSFTLIAVITLSLGIGANSAIFSVVNSVLLRELRYREPQRLVMVWSDRPLQSAQKGWAEWPFTSADFRDLRDQNHTFEQMAAFTWDNRNITGVGEPEVLNGMYASANLFALLGVEAEHGRVFLSEEDRPGNDHVVILSDGLWRRRFGSDPKIIGQTISLSSEPFTVIGVAPPGFQFPPKAGLPGQYGFPGEIHFYAPLAITPEQWNDRGSGWINAIARLKQHASFEQAQTDMIGIANRLAQQYPNSNKNESVRLVAIHQQVIGKAQTALLALLGAAGFTLLIACVNVANLLLVRAATRQKEIAIRVALGAHAWRIIRQLLSESLLLAALSGALALLLAIWGVDLLRMILPDNFPRAGEISVDARVFGFTLVASLLTGLVFGLIPALRLSRTDLNVTIKEGRRGSGGGGRNRLGGLLVVSEVALALLLLVGAGLTLRSFIRLMSVEPGFDSQNALTISVNLSQNRYNPPQRVAFFQQLLERLRTLPGVRSVGAVYPAPGFAESSNAFSYEGQPPTATGAPQLFGTRFVSPDYFKAMKIQLLKGRVFTEADGPDTPPVVVINEAMARQYWPNEDPIGKRVKSSIDGWSKQREIVGVVKDVRYTALDTEARSQMYFSFDQGFALSNRALVARTEGDPLSFVTAVRGEVKALDKDQPISNVHTLEELVTGSVATRRFNMALLAAFAGLALLLAAVGIYGVMSYSVEQRTHEIGLRMALGAQATDALRLLLGQGMKLVATGVAIGLAAAFALTRLISTLLFEVSATDPLTFVTIALLLTAVALLACYIPARRATKIDPMIALRSE